MGAYKIVYRDAAGNDRRAFTTFEDQATIEENLANIVPRAIARGLLHPEATAQNVLVEHKGVRLNPKLPIDQAAPGIKENDEILVRYIASQVNLRIRIEADDPTDQRKIFFGRRRTISIKETVSVSPSEQLMSQIKSKLNEIRGKHKFCGKEVKDVKQFKLRAAEKTVQPGMSLAEQGFETDLEVDVKPRIWFDWPPCFYYGLRGPYTGYAITLGVLIPLIVLFAWLFAKTEVPRFQVTFEAPFECNVKVDDSMEFVPLDNGKPTGSIAAGSHTIYWFPRERPILERPLLLKRTVHGGIGESDSMWTEILVVPEPDTAAVESMTPVTVVGYEGVSSMNNLKVPLLFNGFEYALQEELSWRFELVPGEYEFKFSGLSDDLLLSSDFGEGGITRKENSKFIFVVTDTIETTIKFRYGTGGDS